MILVLVAVGIAVVMCATYAARQSTASAVTRNMQSHTQARHIAESALQLASGYVSHNENWRSQFSEGDWVVDQPYAGGTYTIAGYDGKPGESDGSLSDDVSDPVTLRITGRYLGATHTLSAVLTPTVTGGNKILLVVGDGESLSSADAYRKQLMEGFGWSVIVMDDNDVAAEFDTLVPELKAVYVSNTASANQIDDKLAATALGVVNEQRRLTGDLRIASNASAYNTDTITISDNTHEITSVFALGDLQISNSRQQHKRLTGNLANELIVLGHRPNRSNHPMLAAIDAGRELNDGSASPGRRVELPWGHNNYDIHQINDNGITIMERSLLWATKPMVPPPPIAWYGFDELSGSTTTDSSGNNHTGTLTNGPLFAPGAGTISGAMNFDGVNDYVRVDHTAMLNVRDQITFAAWVKSDNWSGGNPRILQKGNNDNQYRFLSEWGDFKFHLSGVGELTHAYPDNAKWKHLVGTYDGDRMRLYYDGVEVASRSASGRINTTNHPLYIGTKHNTAPAGDHFKGLMDDVRIYDVALNAAEIKYLYEQGKPEDSGPVPRLIALYTFEETVYEPQLLHHWKLDEPAVGAMPGLSLDQSFYADGPWVVVDSYRSSQGVYDGELASDKVGLTVNEDGSNVIQLTQSSVLRGDAYAGPGANVSRAISVSSGADITGLRDTLDSEVDMPNLSAPTGSPFGGGDDGNFDLNGSQSQTINSDRHYDRMRLTGSSRLTISGDVTILLEDYLHIDNDAELVIAPGGSLRLFVKDYVEIEGDLNVANNANPADCRIHMLGNNDNFTVDEDGAAYALVQNPRGDLIVRDQCRFHGGFIGQRAYSYNGRIHVDLDNTVSGAMMNTATDAVASADGIYNGPTRGHTGVDYRAAYFDGSNDSIKIDHLSSMNLDAGAVGLWLKPSTTSGTQGVFSKDAQYYGQGGHLRIVTSGRSVRAELESKTATHTITTGNVLRAGDWTHAVLTFGPTRMKLYINGSLAGSSSHTGGLAASSGGTGNTEPIILGADSSAASAGAGSPLANHFRGYLDDVRIYNQPLDADQVEDLYNQRALSPTSGPGYIVVDNSGFADPLNLYLEDTSKTNWHPSGGLELESATRIASPGPATKLFDALTETDELTVEVVFSPADVEQSGPATIASYDNGDSNRNVTIGQQETKVDARLRTASTNASGTPAVQTGNVVTPTSQHIILAYDKSEVRLYRNNNLEKTVVRSGVLDTWDDTMRLLVGNDESSSSPWLGTITRLAIYDRGVNNLQAEDLFNGDPPGDYSNLKDVHFDVRWIESP